MCHAESGRLRLAMADYDVAVAADPDSWECWFHRGLAKHAYKSQHEATLLDIEAALQATGRARPAEGSFDLREVYELVAVDEIETAMQVEGTLVPDRPRDPPGLWTPPRLVPGRRSRWDATCNARVAEVEKQ
jgi:hypothetical protein